MKVFNISTYHPVIKHGLLDNPPLVGQVPLPGLMMPEGISTSNPTIGLAINDVNYKLDSDLDRWVV